ncbi:MAG: recombinase family protein [Clostridiales bacterium]|nr:recombinase family protein [Clostridiales bacterium]
MNAVIYARYSSHNQTEQSIEGQLHDCYEYAKRYDINIVGEYIDRALSGTTDDRPDFQRMITDASKKQFDRIIVWKLDRFARNRYDSAFYKHKLKQHGIRVISAMENVGEGDESILLEALLEASAEYYSLDLRKKIKRGQRETIAKGRWCGGNIPYGYKVNEGKLVASEKTAPVIQYVFKQYASGVSMKVIIDDLKERGVRTTRGGELTYNTFTRALSNETYLGKLLYGDMIVEGVAEPLIDKDTFDQVQIRLKANARTPAANKAKVEYLLQGKAFCGHCGSHMVGESGTGRHGDKHYYYACATKKKTHACNKRNEKKEALEQYVIEHTIKYVLEPARTREIAKAVVAEYEKEFSGKKITECEKQIKQLDYELNKLVDALIEAPKSAHKRIYEKMEILEQQKASLENDLTKFRIANDIRFTEDEVCAWLRSFCAGDLTNPEFQRNIIDTFINSIYLYDDRVIIFYNIKNNKPVTFESLNEALNPNPEEKGSNLNAYASAKKGRF